MARRTDDGTYPNVEEELEKLEARARDDVPGPFRAVADAERAAREPIDTEHDDDERAAGDGGDDDDDDDGREGLLVRRAEVRVDAVDWIDGLDATLWMALALEEYSDGRRHVVIAAVDEHDTETELARFSATEVFGAIDRLRAFGVVPNPPRERTVGDVHAALENLVRDAGPSVMRALGMSPLRPVPGGKR